MEFWKKLKNTIWFYKEYIVIAVIAIAIFSWLLISVGLNKKPNLVKNKQSSLVVKKPLDSIAKSDFTLNLPSTNFFDKTITNGEFDQEKFITKYKNYLKSLNDVKGKVTLKFFFYANNEKVNSVKIEILFLNTQKQIWKGRQSFNIRKNS